MRPVPAALKVAIARRIGIFINQLKVQVIKDSNRGN